MNIIDKILSEKIFQEHPPVLIDIGASGSIHKLWKKIAKYSICLAFDADSREFNYITKESSGFKKLFIYNCIVSDNEKNESDFYLTKSPYCSSLLEPDNEALKIWAFAPKFNVEQVVKLKTKSLKSVLEELNLQYVDWFKTDSQGTDLRLFKNLPDSIRNKVIAVELEPGFIDSYKNEDKIYDVLKYMENNNFWMSDIKVKGNQRISTEMLEKISSKKTSRKLVSFSLKESPGWAEILYLNNFSNINSRREFLLSWVFSTITEQYGFALELLRKAPADVESKLIYDMSHFTLSKIKYNLWKLKFMPAVFQKISKLF